MSPDSPSPPQIQFLVMGMQQQKEPIHKPLCT